MEDKKNEKIMDDNLNLSFVKISKNLNLGKLKKILLELLLRELKIPSKIKNFEISSMKNLRRDTCLLLYEQNM